MYNTKPNNPLGFVVKFPPFWKRRKPRSVYVKLGFLVNSRSV